MKSFIKPAWENKWTVLFSILAILAILNIARTGLFQTDKDFHLFYAAAHALLSGSPLYAGEQGAAYIYPPFYAFLITPLAHLPETVAANLWQGVNVGLLVLCCIFGVSVFNDAFQLNLTWRQSMGAGAITILLMYNPLFHEFLQGQNDILILFGCTLALYLLDRHPWSAGIILGLIINIKYQALFLLPLLLLRARWRTAGGLAAGVMAGALLPALLIGWQLNLDYLQIALRGMAHIANGATAAHSPAAQVPSILWWGNVSITNGLARIFHDQGWAIENALMLAFGLAAASFWLLWHIYQKNNMPFIWRKETAAMSLEWNAVLVLMLVFSPECSRRHLLLIFNLNLVAVLMILYPRPPVKRWLVVIATVIGVIGEGRISLAPHSLYNTDFLGLPGWGYLIFLLIIVSQGLRYG